jgi:hypothetical protein
MPYSQMTNPTNQLQLEGVLQGVDLVNREIEVADQAKHITLMVPSDCKVFLHGERVKLRLLQPGDRLRITYRERPGAVEARLVEAECSQ